MPELFAVERRREEARAAEPVQRERRPARNGEGRSAPAPGLSPDAMRVHYRAEGTPPPAEPGAAPVQRLRPPGGAAPVVQRLALMAQVPHPDDVKLFERLKVSAVTYRDVGGPVLDKASAGSAQVKNAKETIAFLGHGCPTRLGDLDAAGIVETVKTVLEHSPAVAPPPLPAVESADALEAAPSGAHEEEEERESESVPGEEAGGAISLPDVAAPAEKQRTAWRGSIYLMGCSTGRSYRGNEKEPVPDDEKSLAERVEQAYNSSIEPDVTDVVGTFVSMYGLEGVFTKGYTAYPEVDKGKVNERLPAGQRGPLAENPLKMKLVRMLMQYQAYPGYAHTILNTYVLTTACKNVKPIERGTPAKMREDAVNLAGRLTNMLSRWPSPDTIPWLAGDELKPVREALTADYLSLKDMYTKFYDFLKAFDSYVKKANASRLEQVSLYEEGADEETGTGSVITGQMKAWVDSIRDSLPNEFQTRRLIDIYALGETKMRFNRINETFHTSEAKRRRKTR